MLLEPAVSDLSPTQWAAVEPLLPRPGRRADGRGRPWREPRGILNAILWVIRSGEPWKDLPACYPPYQTCHRRFQQWLRDGTLEQVCAALGEDFSAQKYQAGRRTPSVRVAVRAPEPRLDMNPGAWGAWHLAETGRS
jgi:transposase